MKKSIVIMALLLAAGVYFLGRPPAPPAPNALTAQLQVKLPAVKFSNKGEKP
jgi:hypothetical protein